MNDQGNKITKTNIPARLDRLPWGRFHTLIVIALGITWVLDGLEVTLAGSVAGALETSPACISPRAILAWRQAFISLAQSLARLALHG
jgi:hypothetical protein